MHTCCDNCKNCCKAVTECGTSYICKYGYIAIDDPFFDVCEHYEKGEDND